MADHWIPLVYDDCPGTVPENIVPLCHSIKDGAGGCNNSKQALDPYQWLIDKFGKRKAEEIFTKIQAYFEMVKTKP